MRYKSVFGFSFLMLAIASFLLSYNWNITGGVIGSNAAPSYLYFASIIFAVISLLVFASRQTLDAIMIPTGGYEENPRRTKRALEEYNEGKGAKILLISGGPMKGDKPPYSVKSGQVYQIYEQLRRYGVKPSSIMVEGQSNSTLDNVLFSLERLKKKGVKDIGIASSPSHLDRFENIVEKAKEEGIVGRDFRAHRLELPEDQPEGIGKKLYGSIAKAVYGYKLSRGLKYAQSHQSRNGLRKIRNKLFK